MKSVVLLSLLAAGLGLGAAARAQFTMVPTPEISAPLRASEAEIEKEYRIDAARHIYAAYPKRIFKGRMPPLLYSVMMVETEIDAAGAVVDVHVVRKPAAAEVAPWVIQMIKRASPLPPPSKMTGGARFIEIWLVDKSGLFQLDTLTEGQR